MAALPVISKFDGDFLYNVVLVDDTDTIDEVAQKCAHHSVGRRIEGRPAPLVVQDRTGRTLDRSTTVAAEGVGPMSQLFISYGA